MAKRRGATNIRLTITTSGKVRVGLPNWSPYAAGVAFVRSRSDWVLKQLALHEPPKLEEGALVGKAHRLHFQYKPGAGTVTARIAASQITVSSSLPPSEERVQIKARVACERALRSEAEHLLPQRLDQLAKKCDYAYKGVRIRKLTSRWGSCSNAGIITLSYYLMQLPWRLIDYVLLHELVHTKHLHHGADFWQAMNRAIPEAKKRQKEIRAHRPRVEVAKTDPGAILLLHN